MRLTCIKCSPHTPRGRRNGRSFPSSAPSSDGTLRILINDLETPAELVAQIYAKQSTIEPFFRMFKLILGCKHLLTAKQEVVEIQIYCAIVACMLIVLHTGGWAALEKLEAHIKKLQPPELPTHPNTTPPISVPPTMACVPM